MKILHVVGPLGTLNYWSLGIGARFVEHLGRPLMMGTAVPPVKSAIPIPGEFSHCEHGECPI